MVRTQNGKLFNVKPTNMKRLDIPVLEGSEESRKETRGPVELRKPDGVPSKILVDSHNLTHTPYAQWCEVCIAAKGVSSHHRRCSKDQVLPTVQVDYMYASASGEACDVETAKPLMLTKVDTDNGSN